MPLVKLSPNARKLAADSRGGPIIFTVKLHDADRCWASVIVHATVVVPTGNDAWRASILQPISYAVAPAFDELAELANNEPAADGNDVAHRLWQDSLNDAIQGIAGLTAVDGATVINDRYELLAFGAKIARRDGCPTVEQIAVTEPIEDGEKSIVHPTRLGGTRHLSAAQFVQDQHGALALVASVDGRFTIFAWSPCENIVHAHRVETLLL